MKPSQATAPNLPRLIGAMKRHGVTNRAVAAEASKTSRRGSVGETTVSHVLAGRRKSRNVVDTAKRLIAEAKAAGNGQDVA